MQTQYLLCAYGPDRPGIVEALSDIAVRENFSISDSRMAVLGDHFSVLMLLNGPQEGAEEMKKAVAALKGLTVSLKEVRGRSVKDDVFEYSIRIVGEDHAGIVHEVTNYLKARDANVLSLDTSTGHAPHSGTQLFRMDMIVEVPKKANLRTFKSGLTELCDRLNMDVDAEQAGV